METEAITPVEPNDTRAAFAEGAEFAGLFMQVVLASAAAIILVITLYVVQRERRRRKTRVF